MAATPGGFILVEIATTAKDKFNEMVTKRMAETDEPFDVAEWNVIHTKEGFALWEHARLDALAQWGKALPRVR
jgi:hypothetical protein